MNFLKTFKPVLQASKLNYTLMFFISLFLLSSCEKVVDLDLSNAEPVIVIEGNISDQTENQFVRISKTIPFTESNSFNGYTGAKVTVTTPSGILINFAEVSKGLYRSQRFRGTPGQTYKLEVLADGKLYTASSTMPYPVGPDSVGFKKLSFFGNSNIYPTVYYKDPAGVQNQYRYLLKINSKSQTDIVFEDRFNDGNAVSDVIIYDGDDIKSGDIIDIEMQTIDRNVFKYYFAISQIGGNGGPPVAPANPDSNFNNGALGIFSAYTKSTISIVLK
ncbi:protein of unknown function [Daejeonella rubra]|uniref:DUF4249 domain-containing protein n=1 Tax=Daejeonella rubra TaxID=990371 RepID=A0A1G9RHA2_9SPHI|nr:DUF4249 domain-containing protein [Daejeonella rubra]SDM22614.1 protein of unknown function [Daejeonella rubra]